MSNSEIVFYADENIPLDLTRELRRRNVRVVTTQDVHRASTPDEDQLTYATEHGYVLITYDNDFLRLHRQGYLHTGVVRIAPNCPYRKIINDIEFIAQAATVADCLREVFYLPL